MFGQSLLSAFGSAVACTTDTDQLFTTDVQTTSVATYQLNNATTSIPSNTYPGTASNITYAAGKFGNAAVFNGSSSYIDLGNNLGLANNSFSFSCWIKNIGTGSNSWVFAAEGSGSTNQKLHIGRDAGNGKFYIDFWGNGLYSTSQVTTNSIWQNWVITFDSTTKSRKIYLNGSLDNSDTSSSNYLGTGDINIGQLPSYNQWLQGTLDQVRIFNTALPQSAVTALYNETTTTATYPYVTTEVANPNSVAYYKMSDATDQLGNYNGTATDVNFNTEGKFGFAGAFNGSSSWMDLRPLENALNGGYYSFSVWVNPAVITGSQMIFLTQTLKSNFGLQIYNSVLSFYQYDSSVSYKEVTYTGLQANTWTHIVGLWDGSNIKLYINGSPEGSTAITSIRAYQSNIFAIGKYVNNTAYFNGLIDQIRIYDSAISAANVTTLYNEIECPAVAVTNAFNTVLYTGNGGTQSVTGTGFKPDLSWVKNRNTAGNNHNLADSIRGVNNVIQSNLTAAQYFNSTYQFNSFDTDGITVTDDAAGNWGFNGNNETYVSWNWKAGGAAVSNTDGTITSQVSANVDAGFSILKYTGNGSTAQQSYGHGLSSAPELLMTKNIDTATQGTNSWVVGGTLLGNGGYMFLNGANAKSTASSYNGNKVPDSEVIYTSGTSDLVGNQNGINFITYAFHSVDGYSKFGSYDGDTSNPTFIYTGFRPAFVMIKATNVAQSWYMFDNKRGNTSGAASPAILFANDSGAEYTTNNSDLYMTFSDNGFQPATAISGMNGTGRSFIYMAIA